MLTAYRTITEEAREAAALSSVGIAYLFEFDFPTGLARAWTGDFVLDWNGEEWHGVSDWITVKPVEETTDTGAKSLSVTLVGLENTEYTPADLGEYQGRAARIWFCPAVDFGTREVIGDPVPVFYGAMDSDETTDDPGNGALAATINIVRADADHLRVRPSRWTYEDQRLRHPGLTDKGFEFVAATASQPVVWGVPS